MNLRAYTEADREVAAAIWLTSNIAAHPFGEDFWVSRYPDVYHHLLPALTTLVAEEDGSPEAFVTLSADGEMVFFNTTVCFQKKGHGDALLQAAKTAFPGGLTARVWPENEHGLAFLEKRGFARRPDRAESGELILFWAPNGTKPDGSCN